MSSGVDDGRREGGVRRRPSVSHTVLVVDDDPLILRVVATVLDLEAYEVITVESAEEAMEVLPERSVDVVVTDVMMPGMDGYQLCEWIRSDEATAGLPVIMLTARDADQDRARSREVGGDAHLAKPFSPLGLIETIDRLLADGS